MTLRFVPLPRLAALTVAITLFTASIAAAQSPAPAPSREAATETPLLTQTAFARLVQQPRAERPTGPVVADPRRPGLLRSATAAPMHATPAPKSAPPRQSWTPQSPRVWLLVAAVGVGGFYLCYRTKCGAQWSIG